MLLLEVTRRIARGGSLSALLTDIANVALTGSGADGIRVVLRGDGASSYSAGDLASQMPDYDSLVLEQIRSHEVLEVSDLSKSDAALVPLRGSFGALIALPLVAQQTIYGVLWGGYSRPRVFAADETMFLSILAGQTAVAIANAQAMEAQRHGREHLAAILASSVDPVLVIDAAEKVVLLNPAAERAFRVEAGKATGQPLENVIQAPPLVELLKGIESAPDEAIEWQGEASETYAPRVSDIRDEDGSRTGRVLILRDITRYKNLRDNQSVFVSTVSHDLRSPLTYMHGYASMLSMVGPLNDKQKGFADKIVSGIAQVTDLVDKILDAGRLDPDGNYELNREPCDVYKLVSDVVGSHTQPAEKRNLALSYETEPGIPVLNLDDMMLRRALNNLVDNAIKYTPEGGKVQVHAFVQDNSIVLSVSDTGLGISEENQAHLFERFRRVRRREHNAVKGSGLGLYIVRNLAQRHGGDAWVVSKEGEGSTFNIAIPIEGANLLVAQKKS